MVEGLIGGMVGEGEGKGVEIWDGHIDGSLSFKLFSGTTGLLLPYLHHERNFRIARRTSHLALLLSLCIKPSTNR